MADEDTQDLTPYCGSKSNPPKGKRFGTPQECADLNQIRRYGLNQVDQQVIDDAFERAKQRPKRKRAKSKTAKAASDASAASAEIDVEQLLNQLAAWYEDNKYQIATNILNGQNVDLSPVSDQLILLFEELKPQNFMQLISTVVRRILELIISFDFPFPEDQTEFTEMSNRIETIQQPLILKRFYNAYVTAFTNQVLRLINQQTPIGPNQQIIIPNLPRLRAIAPPTEPPTQFQQLATITPPIPKPTTTRLPPPTRKEESPQFQLIEDDNPLFLAQITPPISTSITLEAPQSKARLNQPMVFTLNPETQTLQFLAETQPTRRITQTTDRPSPSRPIRTNQPLLQLMEGDGREFLAKVNQPIQARKTIDLPQTGRPKSSVQPMFELIEDETQDAQYLAEIQSPLPKQLTTVVSTSSPARAHVQRPKVTLKSRDEMTQILQVAVQSALSNGRDLPRAQVSNNRIYASATTSPHVDKVSGFGKRKTTSRNVMQNLNNFIDQVLIEMPQDLRRLRTIRADTTRENYITRTVLEYMKEAPRRERWIGFYYLSDFPGFKKSRNIEAYDRWIRSISQDPFKRTWVLYYQDIPWM